MRTKIFAATFAIALPGMLAVAAPASAATAFGAHAANPETTWNDRRDWRHDDDDDRGHRGRHYGARHYDDGGYDGPVWRGRDGRYRCRRNDGTTGLLIGGVAGGLLGREVAGRRGDRTAGFLIGAVAGGLIGRSIDRNGSDCR